MTSHAARVEPPPGWVPVERRFLGMDRVTLLPAGIVATLVAVAFWVLPAIDNSLSVDDPVRAGDVVRVGNTEFLPAAGWNLDRGLRAGASTSGGYPDTAVLTDEGLTFKVIVGDFDGTADELLGLLETNNDKLGENAVAIDTGRATSIQSTDGQVGALAQFSTASAEGLIATYALSGTGVEIVVSGPSNVSDHGGQAAAIAAMIRSVRLAEGSRP